MDADVEAVMAETREDIARGVLVPPKVEWWWEPRREGEMTPEYLGRVLDELPAGDLARRARMGHFDDFHAPTDVADGLELVHLVVELRRYAVDVPALADRLVAVENAVRHGEFDATVAESERWAASKDGQETFAALAASAQRHRDKVGRNDPCPCGSGAKYKRCCGA